jgi:hypothetical protein
MVGRTLTCCTERDRAVSAKMHFRPLQRKSQRVPKESMCIIVHQSFMGHKVYGASKPYGFIMSSSVWLYQSASKLAGFMAHQSHMASSN